MHLVTCPSTNAPEHAAEFSMFCDAGSVAHVALGFFAGTLEPRPALALFGAFVAYQISQAQTGESWTRTAGEVLEFSLGIMLSQLTE